MGQTLLSNHFVSGLCPNLKRKLIGMEGGLDELVLKAQFEEVKSRELLPDKGRMSAPRRPASASLPSMTTTTTPVTATSSSAQDKNSPTVSKTTQMVCYNCGMEGHLQRACPYPRELKSTEARGSSRRKDRHSAQVTPTTMSNLVGDEGPEEEVRTLQKKL